MIPNQPLSPCETVKRRDGKCSWLELSFPDLPLSIDKPKKKKTRKTRRRPLSNINTSSCTSNDAVSVCSSLGEDESVFSIESKSVVSTASGKSRGYHSSGSKMKRRGSFGRLAKRLANRFDYETHSDDDAVDDDDTIPTILTTKSDSFLSKLAKTPPPDIRTQNRMGFIDKRKTHFSKTYVGVKERAKKFQQSDQRKGQVMSALYTCVEDDEDDYLSNLLAPKSS